MLLLNRNYENYFQLIDKSFYSFKDSGEQVSRTNESVHGSGKYLAGIIVLAILLVISSAVIAYLIHRTRVKSANSEPILETTNNQSDSRHIYDIPLNNYEGVEEDNSNYTSLKRPALGELIDDHFYAHLNQALENRIH
jgi:hypothetical protein